MDFEQAQPYESLRIRLADLTTQKFQGLKECTIEVTLGNKKKGIKITNPDDPLDNPVKVAEVRSVKDMLHDAAKQVEEFCDDKGFTLYHNVHRWSDAQAGDIYGCKECGFKTASAEELEDHLHAHD